MSEDEQKEVRIAAIERITDEKALIDIAKKDTDWPVRTAAIAKITNVEALNEIFRDIIEIVKNSSSYSLGFTYKEDILFEIDHTVEEYDRDGRGFHSQFDVAPYRTVTTIASIRIPDEKTLIGIAKSGKNKNISEFARLKIAKERPLDSET